MHYTERDMIRIPFFDHKERDLFISCLGYNNFNFITPIHRFRAQSFYTLHIILEGSGTLVVDGKQYRPKEGMMFFIPPDVRLCYYPDEDALWKYVWFELHGENATLYANQMGFSGKNHLVQCKDFSNIKLLFQRIFNDYITQSRIGYYDTLSLFYKILDTHVQTHHTESSLSNAVTSYIHSHYHNPDLSVADLCRYFNISHPYLCKLFKETNGCSAKNYIIQVRVMNSCKLLETTAYSIKEIAFSVGFTDEIHFMKTFKKLKGKTPTQYRRNSLATS